MVRPGTVAFDYRNSPDVAPLEGYEIVVLSHRAPQAALDTVRSWGGKPYTWLQPFVSTWQGEAVTGWPIDAAMWSLTSAWDGLARDDNGKALEVPYVEGCYLLDFTNLFFAAMLSSTLAQHLGRFDGINFDYGGENLAWMWPWEVKPLEWWKRWGYGYREYKRGLQTLQPHLRLLNGNLSTNAPVTLEGVGAFQGLVNYWQAIEQCKARPGSVIFCQTNLERDRRIIASIALLTDCGFRWWADRSAPWANPHAPEFWGIELGKPLRAVEELTRNRFIRYFEKGLVALNLSATNWTLPDFRVVKPIDALVSSTMATA